MTCPKLNEFCCCWSTVAVVQFESICNFNILSNTSEMAGSCCLHFEPICWPFSDNIEADELFKGRLKGIVVGCRFTGWLLWVFGCMFGRLICFFISKYIMVAWDPGYLQVMWWIILEYVVKAIEDFFNAALSWLLSGIMSSSRSLVGNPESRAISISVNCLREIWRILKRSHRLMAKYDLVTGICSGVLNSLPTKFFEQYIQI